MSKRFLVPPTLPSGTSNPLTGNVGDLFFRTDDEKIYVYTATGEWVVASGGGEITNLDGGSASTVYLAPQVVDGGNASDF